MIVWTSKTKSPLSSLYKREEFPLFGKEGLGEIFAMICLLNYGLLSKTRELRKRRFLPWRVSRRRNEGVCSGFPAS